MDPHDTAPPNGSAGFNPFVGLRPFHTSESHLFFGRDEQIYELLRRLRLLHFLAVIGPSGCGKSSLIRAGVMAALEDGYLADDGDWQLVTLQPGNGPRGAWIGALQPFARDGVTDDELINDPVSAIDTRAGRVAILVDQFEELFQFVSRTGDEQQAHAFVEAIVKTGAPDARIYTILTMRSEYLAQCAQYPLLADAINEGLYLVPRMTLPQIEQAIVDPVHKAGGAIAVALKELLMKEATAQADGLPVLQHALMRMWASRQPFEPLGADSSTTSRLGSLLNDHAEQVFTRLGPQEQNAAEKLFRSIVELTAEGRAVRRPMELDAIRAAAKLDTDALDRAIEAFKDEGFLTVTASPGGRSPLVDITHEAIARQWQRLGSKDPLAEGWIVDEARTRQAVQELESAATEWELRQEGKDFLFKGLKLDIAAKNVQDRQDQLSERANRFLAASRARENRLRWLTPKVLLPAGVVLLLVAGLAVYTEVLRRNREKERAAAEVIETQLRLQHQVDEARAAEAETRAFLETLSDETSSSKSTPPPPPPPDQKPLSLCPSASKIRPRVYLHIRDKADEARAQDIKKRLEAAQFVVPGTETLPAGPSVSELRYLVPEEEAEARRAADVIRTSGVDVAVRFINVRNTKARPCHFELWLTSDYRRIFVRGIDAYDRGQYQEASVLFRQAAAQRQDGRDTVTVSSTRREPYTPFVYLALSLAKLNRCNEARDALRQSEALGVTGDRQLADAAQAIATCTGGSGTA